MEKVLDPLDHRGSPRLLSDIDEPLDAQKPGAEVLSDPVQQELQLLPGQRALARQDKVFDALAAETGCVRARSVTVRVIISIVVVAPLLVRIDVAFLVGCADRVRVSTTSARDSKKGLATLASNVRVAPGRSRAPVWNDRDWPRADGPL